MTKTKQSARKMPITSEAERRKKEKIWNKQEQFWKKQERAEQRYVARELARAAKLLRDGPTERRVTRPRVKREGVCGF